MAEIVVVGAFTAKPGQEDAAARACEAVVAPTHAEDGCVLYSLHRGVDDPARMVFLERWRSREALEAHLQSAHTTALLARADELFADTDITVYEPLPAGEPGKGSLAGHAVA